MKRKNFRAAEDWFTFTLAEDPKCWEAWLNRAATRVELTRFEAAIADIEAMGEQADAYPRAWFVRELAENAPGQNAQATRSRQHGLSLEPRDALAGTREVKLGCVRSRWMPKEHLRILKQRLT